MNGHNNTDELLKKMGEAHQRHISGYDENALLLRALEGRRPRQRWAFAGWVVAALIIVGLVIRPMLPALGGGQYADYTINGVKVRAYHSDDQNFPGTFYSFSLEGKEFYIAQQTKAYPDEPLVAEVRLGGSGCILYPAHIPLAEPNLLEAKKFKPSLDLVKDISLQMEKAKLWPADLWGIKPFVKKLARSEYRIEYSGLVNPGFVVAEDMFFGNKVGHYFKGFGMRSESEDLEPVPIMLYIWPGSITLEAYAKLNQYNLYLSGDETGFDLYQTPEWWGEGVRNDLIRIKRYLPQYAELLPLLGESISPSFTQSLHQTTEQVILCEPRALYRADDDMLENRMKPWQPAKSDKAELGRQKKVLAGFAQEFSFKCGDITVSNYKDTPGIVLSKEGLRLSLTSPFGYRAAALITQNGKRLSTKLYVLNEGAFPKLECELRPEMAALLSDISATARAVLNAPADMWPAGQFPKEYVHSWLSALQDRRVAISEPLGSGMLMSTIGREGSDAALIFYTYAKRSSTQLNVRLLPHGFELLNTETGYFVTVSEGNVSAIRTANAATDAITDENVRQLKTAIDILDASKEGVSSAVKPGITAFRDFLEHREVAKAKVVDKLPTMPWAGEVLLDRYAQVSMGIMNLENEKQDSR